MIRYEYACPRCKHDMDEIVQNSDEIVRCPKCGAEMKRIFSAPRVITDTITPGGFFSNQLNMRVDSKSDIKRELHRRGWGAEEFGIQVRREEPKKYKVADDIVDRETDLEIVQEHGGKVSKKKHQQIREKNAALLAGNRNE